MLLATSVLVGYGIFPFLLLLLLLLDDGGNVISSPVRLCLIRLERINFHRVVVVARFGC